QVRAPGASRHNDIRADDGDSRCLTVIESMTQHDKSDPRERLDQVRPPPAPARGERARIEAVLPSKMLFPVEGKPAQSQPHEAEKTLRGTFKTQHREDASRHRSPQQGPALHGLIDPFSPKSKAHLNRFPSRRLAV